jgi:hypothetical protein
MHPNGVLSASVADTFRSPPHTTRFLNDDDEEGGEEEEERRSRARLCLSHSPDRKEM